MRPRWNGRRQRRRRTGILAHEPHVYRGPYEYSVPGHATDFTPQNEPDGAEAKPHLNRALKFFHGNPLHSPNRGPDTGIYNAKLGIWLFLASEVIAVRRAFFRLRFAARRRRARRMAAWLAQSRSRHDQYAHSCSFGHHDAAGLGRVLAWVACKVGQFGKFRLFQPARWRSPCLFCASKCMNTTTSSSITKSG